MMSDLRVAWAELMNRPGTERLASADWPLTVYLSSTREGVPEFLVRSNHRIRGIALGSAVAVTEHFRAQYKDWLLSVKLIDLTLLDPFLTLAVDLLEHASEAPDEETALSNLVRELSNWRRLLMNRKGLTEEAIRGLIAELWYGFHELTQRVGDDAAVSGWHRSATTAQDFVLPNGERHEVKALRPGGKTIQVSSAEQLDPSGGPIFLASVELRDANAQDTQRVLELHALAEVIAGRLATADREKFLEALSSRGYNTTQDYSHVCVVATSLVTYVVGPDFPSIRCTNVPPEVSHLTYALDVVRIAPWITTCRTLETV